MIGYCPCNRRKKMSKLTRFAVPAIAAISLWGSEASAATFVFGIHVLSGQSSSGPVSLPVDFELAFDFPTFTASALSLPSNSGYG